MTTLLRCVVLVFSFKLKMKRLYAIFRLRSVIFGFIVLISFSLVIVWMFILSCTSDLFTVDTIDTNIPYFFDIPSTRKSNNSIWNTKYHISFEKWFGLLKKRLIWNRPINDVCNYNLTHRTIHLIKNFATRAIHQQPISHLLSHSFAL